ncbi:MAG: peptidylprolyl isomerase [candidate division Zixibacteria bacterium]|nr:peptidylprolyl isomerase [candidate division Zixibacteria bacterium]
MTTTLGDMEIEVFENDCPIHAKNFLNLVEEEMYDDNIFHRVIANFMIQTGDPTGTGGGSAGNRLEAEPVKYTNKRSYIAMAQSGQGVNGSQFYILVKDSPHLDNQFPCFAKVIKGMEVADAISKVKTQKDRPVETVKIIEAKPKAAEAAAG